MSPAHDPGQRKSWMPRSLLELPQELIDKVLEYLQDYDEQTLRACKLTCKALVEPSRRILHRSIFISHSRFDWLCRLYTDTSIAQYTREVALIGTSASDSGRSDLWLLTPANQPPLLDLLSKLPLHRIVELTIFHVHWSLGLPSSIRRCFEQYENVVDMYLEEVICPTIELHTFLTGFPHLASLALRNIRPSDKFHQIIFDDGIQIATPPEVTLLDPTEPTKTTGVTPTDIRHSRLMGSLQLRVLTLDNCDTPFVQSLFGHTMPIEDLWVIWNDYRTIYVLQELLCNAGRSLRSLCVNLKDSRRASGTKEKIQRTLTLEHNPAIASLTFNGGSFEGTNVVDWPWAFLSTVTACSLREVEFFFSIEDYREEDLLAFDWDRFANVTADNELHNVNRVSDTVQDVMERKLHRLAGRVHICVRII